MFLSFSAETALQMYQMVMGESEREVPGKCRGVRRGVVGGWGGGERQIDRQTPGKLLKYEQRLRFFSL